MRDIVGAKSSKTVLPRIKIFSEVSLELPSFKILEVKVIAA